MHADSCIYAEALESLLNILISDVGIKNLSCSWARRRVPHNLPRIALQTLGREEVGWAPSAQ